MGFTESGQPDPEFKAWFAGPWKQLTEAVEVPGMRYASWDRKAAYICWRLAHREFDLDDVAALLRYIETGNVNAMPKRYVAVDVFGMPIPDAQTVDDYARLAAGFAPKVGATDPALRMPLVPGPCPICHGIGGHASSCPNGPKASVGNAPGSPVLGWAYEGVNPDEDAACQPFLGGIPLAFDSAKW